MPVLADIVPVRHRLGDLEGRRQFDLAAFVTNHTSAGEPRAVALSADQARGFPMSPRAWRSRRTSTPRSQRWPSRWPTTPTGSLAKGRALFVDLAKKGAWLQLYLVATDQRPGNRPDVAEQEDIQIVSTRSDAIVPFEFIYDHEVPDDDAAICPQWRDALEHGNRARDASGGDPRRVCPWGSGACAR